MKARAVNPPSCSDSCCGPGSFARGERANLPGAPVADRASCRWRDRHAGPPDFE